MRLDFDTITTMQTTVSFLQRSVRAQDCVRCVRCFLAAVLFGALFAGSAAQAQPVPGSSTKFGAVGPSTGADLVRASLWVVEGKIEASHTFTLALVLEVAPTWHVYWRNPGDSGLAPSLRLNLPEGFVAEGPLEFPRPSVLGKTDIVYGYEGKVALLQRVRAPKEFPAQQHITAKATWMACKEICLIGEADLAIEVAPVTRVIPRPQRDVIDAARFTMPTALTEASRWSVHVERNAEGEAIALSLRGKDVLQRGDSQRTISFIPDVTPGVGYGEGKPVVALLEGEGENLSARISVPLEVNSANALGSPLRAAGLILIGDGTHSTDHCYSVDVALTAPTSL